MCLDNLPRSLKKLECYDCDNITMLNNLPNTLTTLSCDYKIKNIDELRKKIPFFF